MLVQKSVIIVGLVSTYKMHSGHCNKTVAKNKHMNKT